LKNAISRDNLRREFASTGVITESAMPSLYDRLSGVYAIATVVDDFIDD
jgi:hypothetical protein